MRLIFFLILFCVASLGFGCANSPVERYQKLALGMDKGDVLDEMGNPRRSQRVRGLDQWVYLVDGQERLVLFESGRVVELKERGDRKKLAQEADEENARQNRELVAYEKNLKKENQENFERYQKEVRQHEHIFSIVPQFQSF